MSPIFRPAMSAGPPGRTSARITPLSRARPSAAARPGVTVWASTPISPLKTKPLRAHLVNHEADDVAGNGKAETFAAARLRENHRVDADEASLDIHQRSAAVARINGRVSLEIDYAVVGLKLPRDGADHTHAHRALEAAGTAHRDYQLALPNDIGIRELKEPQTLGIHLQESEVGFGIEANQPRWQYASWRPHDASARRRAVGRKLHLNPCRAGDDVGVGDDVAVRADDDPGSAGPPQPERGYASRIVRHLLIPLRGHHGNSRGDFFRNPDKRLIQSARRERRSMWDLFRRRGQR